MEHVRSCPERIERDHVAFARENATTTNAASSRLCSLGFKGFRGRSSFAKARAERPEERQVDEFERVATYEGLGRAVLNSAERAQRTRRIEAHRGRAYRHVA